MSHQPTGIKRDLAVIPINTTISGYTWKDINMTGIFDENAIVTNIQINFTVQGPGIYNQSNKTIYTVTSDPETGAFEIDLMPGDYFVEIDQQISQIERYVQQRYLAIPFKTTETPLTFNANLQQMVFANISFRTEEYKLNHSNLQNLSLEFYLDNQFRLDNLPLSINGSCYQGYIIPMNLTIHANYSDEESEYIYIGMQKIDEQNNEFEIILKKPIMLTANLFVDEDGSGDYTQNEEQPNELNITIHDSSGGIMQVQSTDGVLEYGLMPASSYTIKINDTQQQSATHGFRHVRYLSEITINFSPEETKRVIDIPLTKLIKFSGKIFYDKNENENADDDELESNATIHFTGPMNFTVISNESGRFSKFVLPGEYFARIENEGFLNKPKIDSYNVSLDDTYFDIFEIPEKVRVFGYTYFDADSDLIFKATGESEQNDQIIGGTYIEFSKNVIFDLTGEDMPSTAVLAEDVEKVQSSIVTGKYEIYLDPGEYNMYSYRPSTGTVYCSLGLRFFEHTPEFEYNISLFEGQLVEGNVFYRDVDLNEVHDLYSLETGNALKFESLDADGSKLSQYRNGIFDKLYLPYGNYSVTTEYLSEEYELNMDYTLTETTWIQPGVNWYTYELNKENDYSFKFTVNGDNKVELRTADIHEKAFTIQLENDGNIYNIIDLNVEDPPEGWYVHLSNGTIPLDIVGQYSKINVTVDITIPVNAYAENKIQIRGVSRGDETKNNIVTLEVTTPEIYDFMLKYENDLDRGLKVNDTLSFNITMQNLGNAADDIYFKFYNVPDTWNVSLAEAWEAEGSMIYDTEIDTFVQSVNQDDLFNNVTLQVTSPTPMNASEDENVQILARVWSKNRPKLEFTTSINVSIRKPDLIIHDINILNTDLAEGNNITVDVKIENKYCYIENANLSLYINNVLVENKTIARFGEDTIESIQFYWLTEQYNLTDGNGRDFKFRVVANGDGQLDELSYENNAKSVREFIGEPEVEEEFNWRPILAMLSLLVIFIIIYAIYRWRRKI